MSYGGNLRLKVAIEREKRRRAGTGKPRYTTDPYGYARDVLGVTWWHKQVEVAEALTKPPHRVLVKASHNVGKTFLAGGLVNWFFDTFELGICLTTAPTDRQVRDLLWKEVRAQRRGRGGFRGPKMPRLETSANHFAHGFTAKDGDSFQGHHAEHMLFVFDEAVGVDSIFWETAESMFGEGGMWLAIFNPTETSSQAYQEELTGRWKVITISSLDHPNIKAEAEGLSPPYPAAIRRERLRELIQTWCRKVDPHDTPKTTDIEFDGERWRPGPIAESRLLGRWPSQATNTVWSDGVFESAEQNVLPEPRDVPVEIGADVARFGDDFTSLHVRRGPVSLHHETANGRGTDETAGRIKQLADQWGHHCGIEGTEVLCKVDDDGVGGGVVDQKGEYRFIGVSGASSAFNYEGYPNRRSELWFAVSERAEDGQLDLSRLDGEIRRELRRQALAPTWKVNSQGQRVVEPKEETKKRIKRSPDDMDGLNLAYAPVMSFAIDWL